MSPVGFQLAGSRKTGVAPTSWGAFGPHWLWISSQVVESPESPASPASPASPGEFLPDVLCETVQLLVMCQAIVLPIACATVAVDVECEAL